MIELALAGGAVGGAALFARGLFAPRSALFGPVVYRGSGADPPRIALTFDDGPDGAATPRLLDLLAALGVTAMFFVVGRSAEARPDLVRRIHDEGHSIGNHTLAHHRLGTLRGDRYWRAEIECTAAIIEQITGRRPRYFRPPMGFKTHHVLRAARAADHLTVTWTRRGLDGVRTSPRQIIRRLAGAEAGDIIMLHDGPEPGRRRAADAMHTALPVLVETWRARGLAIARLEEVISEEQRRRLSSGAL